MAEKMAWLAVGTNAGTDEATWFYAFTTSDKANHFITLATAQAPDVQWLVYPCVMESAESALANFVECNKEE